MGSARYPGSGYTQKRRLLEDIPLATGLTPGCFSWFRREQLGFVSGMATRTESFFAKLMGRKSGYSDFKEKLQYNGGQLTYHPQLMDKVNIRTSSYVFSLWIPKCYRHQLIEMAPCDNLVLEACHCGIRRVHFSQSHVRVESQFCGSPSNGLKRMARGHAIGLSRHGNPSRLLAMDWL